MYSLNLQSDFSHSLCLFCLYFGLCTLQENTNSPSGTFDDMAVPSLLVTVTIPSDPRGPPLKSTTQANLNSSSSLTVNSVNWNPTIAGEANRGYNFVKPLYYSSRLINYKLMYMSAPMELNHAGPPRKV